MDNEDNIPVEVFAGINWEAEMVKNILENSGIESFLNNEIIGTLVPFYSTPGLGSVTVVVSKSNYIEAKLIVDEFIKRKEEK